VPLLTCQIHVRALLRQDVHFQLPSDNISARRACTVCCRTDLVALMRARCPMNMEKQTYVRIRLLAKRCYGASDPDRTYHTLDQDPQSVAEQSKAA